MSTVSVTKESLSLNLLLAKMNNKFKINESTKEIIIGKENKKIVSTERGQKIYEFMSENFDSIFSTISLGMR